MKLVNHEMQSLGVADAELDHSSTDNLSRDHSQEHEEPPRLSQSLKPAMTSSFAIRRAASVMTVDTSTVVEEARSTTQYLVKVNDELKKDHFKKDNGQMVDP